MQLVHGVEQTFATTEKNWHLVKLHFVDQTRVQVLLRDMSTAGQRYVRHPPRVAPVPPIRATARRLISPVRQAR